MTTPYGTETTPKPEPHANGDEPTVKLELDSFHELSGTQSDEDIYEDAGDLDFSGAIPDIYLTRIPRLLWENWSKLDDDQEIRIGTVRIEGVRGESNRMSLLLSSNMAQNKNVPKEYNMNITNSETANTFIFSEKDLPGFSSRLKGQPSSRVPRFMHQNRTKNASQHDAKYTQHGDDLAQQTDKYKRPQPYYKTAIPKRTALTGQVRTEINCLPVENAEYHRITNLWTRQQTKPKVMTRFVPGAFTGQVDGELAPGTIGPSGDFSSFTVHKGSSKAKTQENKSARMPQNELMDLIYNCFKRYNYWSTASLKAELRQPEAYLKQTLEMVAQFIRQGSHAMTWQLKPEARIGIYSDAQYFDQVKDEAAPDMGFDGASDYKDEDDDDDENVKMEDVMPL